MAKQENVPPAWLQRDCGTYGSLEYQSLSVHSAKLSSATRKALMFQPSVLQPALMDQIKGLFNNLLELLKFVRELRCVVQHSSSF